jgi:hypothetical protein
MTSMIVLAAVLLLSACQLPRLKQAELPDDGPPIATSQQDALQFLEKVTDAGLAGTQDGQLHLTITEQEVTSFLQIGAELAQQVQDVKNIETLEELGQLENLDGLEDIEGIEKWQQLARRREGLPKIRLPDLSLRWGIEEPEVRFQANGQIVVRGYATVRKLRQPVRVVVAPRASEGELVLDFVEGDLGPVPLPEGLFDLVGKGLAQAILIGQDYAEITTIEVSEGTLTVGGQYAAA